MYVSSTMCGSPVPVSGVKAPSVGLGEGIAVGLGEGVGFGPPSVMESLPPLQVPPPFRRRRIESPATLSSTMPACELMPVNGMVAPLETIIPSTAPKPSQLRQFICTVQG